MKVQAFAPTRISLFGGGTDVEPYASNYGGLVLSMAINLRQRIILEDAPEYSSSNWSLPEGGNIHFYETILNQFNLGVCHLDARFDGIIESGIGSSASAAVAIVGAVNRLKGLNLTKDEIAETAWDIEVNKLGLFGGKQDQYAASFGGVNVMEFSKQGVDVTPLANSFVLNLLPCMVLLYSGEKRKLPKVQENLKELDDAQIASLTRLKLNVVKAVEYIDDNRIKDLGELMNEAWEFKKYSNPLVSNPEIDEIYTKALSAGAYGGKLLGSGSGGYMLFIVPPEKRADFIAQMGLPEVDFSVDFNGLETRIL